jgi:hypothetical protein
VLRVFLTEVQSGVHSGFLTNQVPEKCQRDVQVRVFSLGTAQPNPHGVCDALYDLEFLMLERRHSGMIRGRDVLQLLPQARQVTAIPCREQGSSEAFGGRERFHRCHGHGSVFSLLAISLNMDGCLVEFSGVSLSCRLKLFAAAYYAEIGQKKVKSVKLSSK